MKSERREFLRAATALGAAGLAGAASSVWGAEAGKNGLQDDAEISPVEDLMREHGVLRRVLLVYGEVLRRLEANENIPYEALADAAGIVRAFVEDYHEKLEEDQIFPRFKKANKLVELVDVLLEQHRAGRRLTDTTLRLSQPHPKQLDDSKVLAESMRLFIRLYSPHAAREDTVLFPAFRGVCTTKEYATLGDAFEKKENELFGAEGFEKSVVRVGEFEKKLDIYDLAKFTPRL